jgi:hypothetical protein
VPNRAVVFDVDDTTLTTWNYELYSNWDFNAGTNANFVGLTGSNPAVFTGNMFPATPGMLDLLNRAHDLGYAIFFVTGRGDSAARGDDRQSPERRGSRVLEHRHRDAVRKDDHGGGRRLPRSDPDRRRAWRVHRRLFTKPPVTTPTSYPAYLDTPEFCGPFIHATPNPLSCPTIQYKSGTRAYIESKGYDIVANFGDQFSDLENGFADKTFKMPNPNYYLP